MDRRLYTQNAALGAGAVAGALSARTYAVARRTIRSVHRLACAGSRVIDTAWGPIEYAEMGDGPPVLLLHGATGGYLLGLAVAQRLGPGFRYIVPSRPGYLRTPLRGDASPAGQAEAQVALLDALGIGQAGLWSVSGSGLTVVEMAVHHADRLLVLVLLSPVAWTLDMERKAVPLLPGLARGHTPGAGKEKVGMAACRAHFALANAVNWERA